MLLLETLLLVSDTSAPYFASGLIETIVFAAMAFYAFRISLAGRPVFSEPTRS